VQGTEASKTKPKSDLQKLRKDDSEHSWTPDVVSGVDRPQAVSTTAGP